MENAEGYSNLVLDQLLRESGLSHRDKSFASVLFYGVLERRLTLDTMIAPYIPRGLASVETEILMILRMSFYQLSYMDGVEDFAAVHEGVALCQLTKRKSAGGFVNAVLRSFIRDGKPLRLPDPKQDPESYYSLLYSCPRWLVAQFAADYGWDAAIRICEASIGKPPLFVRVNTTRISAEALAESFRSSGIDVSVHPYLPGCLRLNEAGGVAESPQYRDGLFHVQDLSSQICAAVASSFAGKLIFDVCAAPGGKTFSIAQACPQSHIQAFDLHQNRVRLIQQGAKRLGLGNVEAKQADASQFDPDLGQADVVLCDAPCSGLGILRRKPEIKYKTENALKGLPGVQYRILSNVSRYVREGGVLIYSTCSISKAENEQVTARFLKEHPFFVPQPLPAFLEKFHQEKNQLRTENTITFLPGAENQDQDTDGFYIAVLQRKEAGMQK